MTQRKKSFFRSLGRYVFYSIHWLYKNLPAPLLKGFGILFYGVGRIVLLSKRKVVLRNLQTAYKGEKSEAELKQLSKRFFDNTCKGMLDLIYLADRPHELNQCVDVKGLEHLTAALEKGQGAILVSAHFGNFILMYAKMVLLGYPTNVIMKRVRDEKLEEYISDFRDRNRIQTIYDLPARACVQQCIKALRRNELLFILLDQNYGSSGRCFVDFFGKKAATAAGPVVFSLRTGAPVVPVFIRQDRAGHHVIEFLPAEDMERSEDESETNVVNVQKLTNIIEHQIRNYPHEWSGWAHKRWKSQPASL